MRSSGLAAPSPVLTPELSRRRVSSRARASAARGLLYLGVAGIVASVRFLGLVGFSNDQYVSLTGAQQMLLGDLPTRDFLDPGLPLMYAASAGAQLVFGRNLFAEAMLVSGAFGLAAAVTIVAVRELTGSLLAGIVATAFEVAIFPLTYSYPKVLLYAAGPLFMWSYVRRPSLARLTGLTAFVVFAFLFRHDHGIYLGCGGAVAVAFATGSGIHRRLITRVGVFAGLVGLGLLPYFLYLAVHGGVLTYFARGLAFSAAESERTTLMTPAFGAVAGVQKNGAACLYYLFHLLPIAAVVVLIARLREPQWRATTARVAPVIVLALLVNHGFLRETLSDRLPDAIVPALLLAAWLITTSHASTVRGHLAIVAVTTILVATSAIAVAQVGHTSEQLNRASLFGGLRRLPERFVDRSEELHERFATRQMPAGPVFALLPLFAYLDRCTTQEHRLLLPGFIPEVAFYAQRPFAGGRPSFFPGTFTSADDQAFSERRLAREVVPVAIVSSQWRDSLFPFIRQYISDRFEEVASYPFSGGAVDVLMNRTLTPVSRDAGTGWPCFR